MRPGEKTTDKKKAGREVLRAWLSLKTVGLR